MFKFLVLGVFLWQKVVSGDDHHNITDIKLPGINLPAKSEISPQMKKDLNKAVNPDANGMYNFHASQQIFYLQAPFVWQRSIGLVSNSQIDRELNSDYIVTNGMGAHKLHVRKLSWNRARRVCVEEGGHLTIIRTDSEEKIILEMMLEQSINDVWVGYHDKFEEGDWVSVMDEPLAQTGWARWSKAFTPNPDNYQDAQHCARLIKEHGMDDDKCEQQKSFICKIAII